MDMTTKTFKMKRVCEFIKNFNLIKFDTLKCVFFQFENFV